MGYQNFVSSRVVLMAPKKVHEIVKITLVYRTLHFALASFLSASKLQLFSPQIWGRWLILSSMSIAR
jgi:hypothetical protein